MDVVELDLETSGHGNPSVLGQVSVRVDFPRDKRS